MSNAEKFEQVFGFDPHNYWFYQPWWDELYQAPESELQHVGYTDEQLGYDK